jgi:hypothetical protein
LDPTFKGSNPSTFSSGFAVFLWKTFGEVLEKTFGKVPEKSATFP